MASSLGGTPWKRSEGRGLRGVARGERAEPGIRVWQGGAMPQVVATPQVEISNRVMHFRSRGRILLFPPAFVPCLYIVHHLRLLLCNAGVIPEFYNV